MAEFTALQESFDGENWVEQLFVLVVQFSLWRNWEQPLEWRNPKI
jgi:hypothetical protein